MSTIDEIQPVPVHVVSTPDPKPTKPRRKAATLRTILLNVTNPVQPLLGHSPNRCEAFVIQYGDADFVISHSENQASMVNSKPDYSQGADGTLIPKGILAPVPLDTTDDIWVTATSTYLTGSAVLRVGVIDITWADD
jgi:hypothetical protein